ncbi:MAG: stage II sporulation protein M [bacterium]
MVEYKKSLLRAFENLKEARESLYFAVALFFIGAVAGLLQPNRFDPYIGAFRQFLEHFEGRSTPVLIIMIFFQNLSAAFLSFWLGMILGLVPAVSAVTNGLLLGLVLSLRADIGLTAIILKLLPHGVFEIPAMVIAWGLGIWRGSWLLRKNREESYRDRAGKAYHVFFFLVIPLLMIAAVIEGSLIALSR